MPLTSIPSAALTAGPTPARRTTDLLLACRRIFLRNFEVALSIGVPGSGMREPQRVIINTEVYVPLFASASQCDALQDVVDYDFIRDAIHDCTSHGPIEFQETLCDQIISRLLAHPKIYAARVCTETEVYPDCDAVGVEVFKNK